MSKLNKLSLCLTDKFPISDVDSENFVSTIFAIIRERLETDHQVKVKGLGTFKLTEMNARESVDINTGERIRIEGRYKLSFTPENSVRDRINSPFASFESVDLDDENIDFTSIDEKYEPKESINPIIADAIEVENIEEPSTVDTVQQPDIEDVAETKKSIENSTKETDTEINNEVPVIETNNEDATIEKKAFVVGQVPIVENTTRGMLGQIAPSEDDSKIEPEVLEVLPHNPHCEALIKKDIDYSKKILIMLRWILALIVVVLACVGAYFIYNLGRGNGAMEYHLLRKAVENNERQVLRNNSVDIKKKETENAPDKAKDTLKQKPVVQVEKKNNTENDAVQNPNNIYNVDARVRTGAYNIVGLDQTVTVRAGQTLKSISKAYLGEGMECYIEVYNGITSVKEGDKLRIPKLQLKKKSKKK